MIKEWKNIKGYENLYKVSNYGEIKAKRKVIYALIDGEMQPSYIEPEHLLTPTDNGNGYKIVGLVKEGKRKNHYVHRLVAEAFLECDNKELVVNHIDYNRSNNKVTNLEWVTTLENVRYSMPNKPRFIHGKKPSSGHRYISKRGNRFRVCIGKPRRDVCFDSLEDALNYRNRILAEVGHVIDE